MRIFSYIIEKIKSISNDLIAADMYTIKNGILDLLKNNPYTAQDLDEILGIDDISKTQETLDILEKENLIQKADFRENYIRSKIIVDAHLYFSNEYTEKVLEILKKESRSIPDLTQDLHLKDEFQTWTIITKLFEDGKISIADPPNNVETIVKETFEGTIQIINLIRYAKVQQCKPPSKKE